MLRFWLLPLFTLLAGFSAFITLLTQQPYRNTALEALLTESGPCETPCWAEIQPGITSLGHATTLLQQQDWVTSIEFTATTAPGSGFLFWSWDNPPGQIIDTTRQGSAGIHRGIVTWLQIPTILEMGDVWLANGQPLRSITRAANTSQFPVRHVMIYDEQSVQWRSAIACPWHVQNFWQARLDLWLGMPSVVDMPSYNRPTRTACRNG